MATLTGMRAEWVHGYEVKVSLEGSGLAGKTYQLMIAGSDVFNGVVPESLSITVDLSDSDNNYYEGQEYYVEIAVNAEETLWASCNFVFAPITTPQPEIIHPTNMYQKTAGEYTIVVNISTINAIGRYCEIFVAGKSIHRFNILSDDMSYSFDLSDYGYYPFGIYDYAITVNTDTEPVWWTSQFVLYAANQPEIMSFTVNQPNKGELYVEAILHTINATNRHYYISLPNDPPFVDGIITSDSMNIPIDLNEIGGFFLGETYTFIVSINGDSGSIGTQDDVTLEYSTNPVIDTIYVAQNSEYSLDTTVTLSGVNLVGGSYNLYINNVLVKSGIINDDLTINNVTFQRFGVQEVKIEVTNNGASTEYSIQANIIGSPSDLILKIGKILYEQNVVYVYSTYSFDIDDTTICLYVKPNSSNEWEYITGYDGVDGIWSFRSYAPIYGTNYDVKISCVYKNEIVESDAITINIKELPTLEDPQNLQIKRLNNSLYFSWDVVNDANVYHVDYDTDNGDYIMNDAYTNSFTLYEVGYGVSRYYTVYAGFQNKYYIGECLVEEHSYSDGLFVRATSAPARPTIISATQDEGVITVDWTLEDTSSPVSIVWVNLYDSNDTILQKYEATDSKSGTVTYEAVEDGTYYVKIAVALDLSNPDYDGVIQIQSKNDDGTDFKLISDAIIIGDRPAKWEWKTAITPGTFTLDGKNIIAVTATEWNDFTARINDVRAYAIDQGISVSGNIKYAFTPASRGMEFTKEIYNEAANSINEMGGNVANIVTGTILSPSLFTNLSYELNNAIDVLEDVSTREYITYPIGKDVGTPFVEWDAGGYYYKRTNGYGIKSVETTVDFSNVVMKFNDKYPNYGYVFLSCRGSYEENGPEFGICTTYLPDKDHPLGVTDGNWVLYTREAHTTDIVRYDDIVIFEAVNNGNDEYVYNDTPIVLRITLQGNSVVGQILRNGNCIVEKTLNGESTGIGENSETNIFTVGVSYVPHPQDVNYVKKRDAYLKYVKLKDGKAYEEVNYKNGHDWLPDLDNPVTWFGLVVRPGDNSTKYIRYGTSTEEISMLYE